MNRPALPPKYRLARDILRLTSAFITDYRAASVYAAIERDGWEWSGKQWIRSARNSPKASE